MNFKHLFYVAIWTLWFTSCDNMGQKNSQTPGGFAFEKTESGSGEEATEMDYVFFTLKVQGDDGRILTELKEGENIPYLQINNEPLFSPDVQAIADILRGSKVGDSYKVTIPMDSIPQKSPDVAMLKYVDYFLTIMKIRNQEEFDTYTAEMEVERNAKMEVGQMRAKQIEELISTKLKDYNAGKLDVKTTDSGLKYHIVEAGEGDNAEAGNNVTVNYYGVLEDGTRFDDSFSKGMPFTFKLGIGQVIKGWDECITLLNQGSKSFLFIPYDLAYGEAGSPPVIPPSANLVFYVELDDIQKN